jgi:hypothetical protein
MDGVHTGVQRRKKKKKKKQTPYNDAKYARCGKQKRKQCRECAKQVAFLVWKVVIKITRDCCTVSRLE